MTERREHLAGLFTVCVGGSGPGCLTVVGLHGYGMRPVDLSPFAHSLGVEADFYFPAGPVDAVPAGHAWWPLDMPRPATGPDGGPRDLYREHPPGVGAARRHLGALVDAVIARHPGSPLVMLGFSQGGMLACDAILRGAVSARALVLLSASRLSLDEWTPLASRLRGLPVLVSHGDRDPDLDFRAGEALRDFCVDAGADVTWVPFQGQHEIPLPVWRRIRRFLSAVAQRAGGVPHSRA